VWTWFQIGRLAAESTDTSWNPCFVHDQKVLFKLCRCDYRASAAACDAPQPTRPAAQRRCLLILAFRCPCPWLDFSFLSGL